LQGYGQTESAPVISCNPPDRVRIETVGPAFHGVEVRIADDGEICVRGELVMQGYWNNPEATAAAVQDGWLHTGDIGVIDDDGYIRITDRKKDIIVNSGGDNIAPQRIEGFLTLQPEINQAMVYGDRRPHLVALIVPEEGTARAWAAANGRNEATLAELCEDGAFQAHIGEAVKRVNDGLGLIERVRRFILTPEPFTVDNEQMTPTMKPRRHILRRLYGERLEALYR
jgi:long-chain acyl-CoA synthetase